MNSSLLTRWEDHYVQALRGNPLKGVRGLLAYNSVVDKVRLIDDAFMEGLTQPATVPPIFAKGVDNLEDLAEGLSYSISNGLALEALCSPQVIRFLQKRGGYDSKPGGQVVTVARLLSSFGARTILVHPDRFNWEIASLYQGTGARVPLVLGATPAYPLASEFYWECEPEVHYILEYPQGASFGGQPAPRANRFIAAPRTKILFHQDWAGSLPEACKEVDLFFVAGLNHMGEDFQESFVRVREHMQAARAANPGLTIHLEITSVPDLKKRTAILEDIIPMVDSVGVNETELADLAFLLGHPSWESVRLHPYQQVEAMSLLRTLGVRRVHMHTLGYYLVLGPNPKTKVRESLLYASLVGGARALTGENPTPEDLPGVLNLPLADRGLKAMKRLAEHQGLEGEDLRTFLEEGWVEGGDLVAVPTRMVASPRYTVGLGDTISGAAVFAEGRISHPQG